jgi:hypothetical protein
MNEFRISSPQSLHGLATQEGPGYKEANPEPNALPDLLPVNFRKQLNIGWLQDT